MGNNQLRQARSYLWAAV